MLLAKQKEDRAAGGALGVTDATRPAAAERGPKPKVDVLASHLVEGRHPRAREILNSSYTARSHSQVPACAHGGPRER